MASGASPLSHQQPVNRVRQVLARLSTFSTVDVCALVPRWIMSTWDSGHREVNMPRSSTGLSMAHRPNEVRHNIGEAGERIRQPVTPLMTDENATLKEISARESSRLLGISARAHSFGWIVIEEKAALDCGVRTCYRAEFDDCLGDRFERILRTYHPSAVIILSARSIAANRRAEPTQNAIKTRARKNKVSTICIRPNIVRRHFAQHNAATKHEIAAAVAQILPELAWRLPPKRKPWQNEHYSMAIFDAAAAAIAFSKS